MIASGQLGEVHALRDAGALLLGFWQHSAVPRCRLSFSDKG